MTFKPKLWPTIFTIFTLIVLLALGTWQVKRLLWKNNLIAAVDSKVDIAPVYLPETIDDIEAMQYRRFWLTGRYLHDKEMHLFTGPKVLKGDPGYNIITPFEREDGSVVLVDRGWVPSDKKEQDQRPETLIAGAQIPVEGMLHKGERPAAFTHDNDIMNNIWFWIDTNAASVYVEKPLQDIYIRRLKKEWDPKYPIGGDATIEPRNDHLQYAITWYSLAVILIIIYVLFHLNLDKKTTTAKRSSTPQPITPPEKPIADKKEVPVNAVTPIEPTVVAQEPPKEKPAAKAAAKKTATKKTTSTRKTTKKSTTKSSTTKKKTTASKEQPTAAKIKPKKTTTTKTKTSSAAKPKKATTTKKNDT